MTQKQAIQLFEQRKVRTVWDDDAGKWYVAIVDVVAVLTDSIDAAAYWRKLKQRLKAEGNETVTSCHGLKMPAAAEILGAAGVSYRIEELRPHAVRRTESEKEGEMRVVRQRETADHTLILSICSIYE